MKKITSLVILIILIILLGTAGFLFWKYQADKEEIASISSIEECIAANYSVVSESYPRQCKTADGRTFTEDIGNALEKENLIRVENPRPNQLIGDSLVIKGEARGFWFFEASFPIKLLDGNGNEIAINPAFIQAQGEWMTEEFVPFEATIQFEAPATKKGTLILKKDNPSGLPENDDELTIPVNFFQGISY